MASEASNAARETGAVARLHSALMAVLTHLVNRLGTVATQHPQISQVGTLAVCLCYLVLASDGTLMAYLCDAKAVIRFL